MSKFIGKFTTIIFTKKILKPRFESLDAINHMHSLHQHVKCNPSFIRASSYWNHDYTQIYTISHWKDTKGWESWLSGQERYSTYGKVEKEMYESESHQHLTEIVKSNNIFLL